MFKRQILLGLLLVFVTFTAMAVEYRVTTILELNNAFGNSEIGRGAGDKIILVTTAENEGVFRLYDGGGNGVQNLFRSGFNNVVIESEDSENPAIIDGSASSLGKIHLRQPKNVIIQDIVIQNMNLFGINIDDNTDEGEIPDPWTGEHAKGVKLRNLLIKNIGGADQWANDDAIKLSGVDNVLIENVEVNNWGAIGSAVDMVGCHDVEIKNSLFRSSRGLGGVTGVVSKGGSSRITTKNNRFEFPSGIGVAVKLGGSTDGGQIDEYGYPSANLFRFSPDDPLPHNYEAKDITAECNTVIDGKSAFSYVNIAAGGRVQNNLIYQPTFSILRILSESEAPNIGPTKNGDFSENIVVIGADPAEVVDPVSPATGTQPETFSFTGNQWFKSETSPELTVPTLPSSETSGIYGVDPGFNPLNPISLCGCNDMTHLLLKNQWQQISLPCDPGTNNTVAAVFGDDDLGTYNSQWVVYSYETNPGGYKKLAISDPLKKGVGYWIIQQTDNDKMLDLPATSTPVPVGAFDIELETTGSKAEWHMVGSPFKAAKQLNDVQVVTTSPPCASPGCNLTAAKGAKIVYDTLWTYNGNYTVLGINGQLDPWKGYWVATLKDAHGKSPTLRLP